jgi:phospholipid/cholesterol/gamma-HCH transport system substrate-binding protein
MSARQGRKPVVLGVLAVVLVALIGLATLYWERLPVVGAGPEYTAEFTEAAGVKEGDEVRVAGVKIGAVTGVELAGDRVRVHFRAKGAWLGDRTAAAIKIKTVLGQKNVVLDPLGEAEMEPGGTIPLERTFTPYDINDAFGDLASAIGEIDTDQVAESFATLAEVFSSSTPDDVQAAFEGLAEMSTTISERDEDLRRLLANTAQVSETFAEGSDELERLIGDGGELAAELNRRREAIADLLAGTRDLSRQLAGLVADNSETIGPALERLERVATVLERNQDELDESLRLSGPFYRLVGDAVSSGSWIDIYVCGLIAPEDGKACQPPKKGAR